MADMKQQFVDLAVDAFKTFSAFVERVTYTQVKPGVYSNTTRKMVSASKKNVVDAIFLNVSKEQRALVDLVQGDMLVLLAGKTTKFVPELNDTVTRGKDTYTVVGIQVDPAGAVIKLQVRL